MENFGIINVWLEHYYFLTGTSETSFFGQEFCYMEKKKKKKTWGDAQKVPIKLLLFYFVFDLSPCR